MPRSVVRRMKRTKKRTQRVRSIKKRTQRARSIKKRRNQRARSIKKRRTQRIRHKKHVSKRRNKNKNSYKGGLRLCGFGSDSENCPVDPIKLAENETSENEISEYKKNEIIEKLTELSAYISLINKAIDETNKLLNLKYHKLDEEDTQTPSNSPSWAVLLKYLKTNKLENPNIPHLLQLKRKIEGAEFDEIIGYILGVKKNIIAFYSEEIRKSLGGKETTFINMLTSYLDGLYELVQGKKIPKLLDQYVELLNELNS